MTKPHSHRGEPRDEENETDREPHKPAHIAVEDEHTDEAEKNLAG